MKKNKPEIGLMRTGGAKAVLMFASAALAAAFLLALNDTEGFTLSRIEGVFAQTVPAAPTNVTAVAVSSSQIDLSWQDVSNETGYLIYRSTNSNLSDATVVLVGQNAVSYSDTKLQAAITYYYQVWACNNAGCSQSSVVNATPSAPDFTSVTTQGTPAAPTNVNVQKLSACGIRVSWQWSGNTSNLAGFQVWRKEGAGVWGKKDLSPSDAGCGGSGTLQCAITDSELKTNTTYEYYVKAALTVAANSVSDESNHSIATTDTIPVPPAPTNLQVTEWASNGNARLNWSHTLTSFDKSGFRVSRNDRTSVTTSTLTLGQFNTSKEFVATSTETVNTFTVQAWQSDTHCAAVTNSTPESADHVRFSPPSTSLIVPESPKNLRHSVLEEVADAFRVRFEWGASREAGTYGFEVPGANISATTTATSVEREVATQKQFMYRVRACREGDGNRGCSGYVTGALNTEYVRPLNLSADLRAVRGSGSVKTFDVLLRWYASAGITHETNVYRRTQGSSLWEDPIKTFPVADTCAGGYCTVGWYSWADENLPPGAYEYRVTFHYRNASGQILSERSSETSINLTSLTPITGWAWAAAAQVSIDTYHGVGWISLRGQTAGGEPYGVSARADGELHGFMWAGPYGWLSFNAGDTGGCPGNAPCRAVASPANGAVSGWARFVQSFLPAPPGQKETRGGAWDGWVSLSPKSGEPNFNGQYGLRYATTTENGAEVGKLSGFAWGGDVTGWMYFGEAPPAGPARPDLIRADLNPTASSLTLEFRKPMDYDTVSVYQIQSANPQSVSKEIFIQNDQVNVSSTRTIGTNNDQVTVTGLSADAPYGFFLRGTKAREAADSEIKQGRTSPTTAPTINLNCTGRTTSTLTMSWSENIPGTAHTLTLYGTNAQGGNRTQIASGNPPLTLGSGNYPITGLSAGTTYHYVMASGDVESQVAHCTTSIESDDAPSLLYVWPMSSDSLYVNWKNNAVRAHTFTLERMKLTPEKPAWRTVNNRQIEAVGSNAIRLYWTNPTNTQTDKGPYYHEFERSTSSDANVRFGRNDRSSTTVDYASTSDVRLSGTAVSYTFTDSGLEDATEYWYRLRGCSFLRVDLTRENPEVPSATEKACGRYADTVIATTTLPANPDFQFMSYGERELEYRFRDNSRHEDGYEVRVSPCPPGATCAGGIYETLSAIAGSETWTTKTLSNLSYGTEYTVEVRAFRNERAVTGKIYSAWVGDTRTTKPYLATDPGEGGTISPVCATPPGSPRCFYDYNIANNSGFTTVTVSATHTNSNFEFVRLDGCDSYTPGATSCSVTVNTGRAVAAVYNRIAWDYRVSQKVNDGPWQTIKDTTCVATDVDSNSTVDCPAGGTSGGCTTTVTGCSQSPAVNYCNRDYDIQVTKTGTCGSGFEGNSLKSLAREIWNGAKKLAAAPVEAKVSVRRVAPRVSLAATGSETVARALGVLKHWLFGAEEARASQHVHQASGIRPTDEEIEAYFARFRRSGLNPSQNPSVFKDEGLAANTVYLYRVKAVYNAGGQTAYSLEGAGKTLPAGGTVTAIQVRVCTRSSFCDIVGGTSTIINGITYSPLNTKDGARFQGYGQCRNNNDCRDTHTSRQFFEER